MSVGKGKPMDDRAGTGNDPLAATGSGTSVISIIVPVIGATTSTVVGVVELVTVQLPLSSRSELHRGEAGSCRQQWDSDS